MKKKQNIYENETKKVKNEKGSVFKEDNWKEKAVDGFVFDKKSQYGSGRYNLTKFRKK